MALAKLSELLSSVKDNSYAIGSFNVSNMEMAMGAIKAAEKMQAPIIIQIAEGRLRYSPLEILGPIMMAAAKNTTVPIAVHLDHGGTMETIKLALELGFTSVMFDGSKYPLEENIARTKEVIALAKSYGADVEAEIGRVGGAEGDYKAVDIALTSVEEAKCFAEETKVDALAVAIGTAHGNYKETPKLHIYFYFIISYFFCEGLICSLPYLFQLILFSCLPIIGTSCVPPICSTSRKNSVPLTIT